MAFRPRGAGRRPGSAALLLLLAAAWLAQAPAGAQSEDLPRANTVVEPRAYVSLEPVPRGRAFELAVVANIRPGFHINAHDASQEYLIPTTLEADLPTGFRAVETLYPPGTLRKFDFSPVKLSVYQGSVTLRMKLQALADAPLGARKLALTLRYQACSEDACLPPVKLPVAAELEVAPAGTPVHPAHPTIFQTPRPKAHSPR